MKKILYIIIILFSQLSFSQADSLIYYFNKGEYDKAINYGETQKEISKIKDSNYALLVNNLATTYSRIGDAKNSELNYLEELELEKSFFGENHKIVAITYRNLGNVCSADKDYKKAETYFFKAIEVFQKGNNTNKTDYTDCLLDLGVLLKEIKDYKTAEIIFNNAEQLLKLYHGEESVYYLKGLLTIAIFYYDINNKSKSDEIISNITNYYKTKDINHFELKNKADEVFFLFNVAELFRRKNDLKNSEKFYKLIIELSDIYIGKSELIYSDILYYSSLYNNLNNEIKNIELFEKFSKNFNLHVSLKTNYFTSNELSLFKNDFYFRRFPIISFLQRYPTQYPEINIGCYENELLLKNLSLRNQQRIKTTIEKNGDANIKEKYQHFIENKRYITKLDELSISERPNTYDQLKTETENLEKELTRLSSTFADAKKSLSINWKQIQEKLKPNEVIIDLVSYNYYNKKWTDSIIYAAFVIKKDSKFPKYFTLFEQKQLATLLERNNNEADTIQTKILNKQYSDKTIGNLFYQPLEQELKGCKTIYLAPSGLTHQINFKALPINDNQTFGEQFEIKLVGSTASIIDYKPTSFQEKKDLEFILYGGIDYNKKNNEIKTDENQNSFNALATRSGILEFNYLPGTNIEVEKINTEAKKFNFNTIVKTEKNATEESIKQLDGKTAPFVLHLATHGFFFENIKQEKQDDFILIEENTKRKIYKSSEDPMMRSGLIFAGANKYWGKSKEETTTEDGILTAKEISNLDLSHCQLVVLSACETGLGQVNGSEGVFGLQRAFKMAGVKNIIMSLWKVPDSQTAELFELFYSECFSGKSIQEAFQSTQAKMKAKYSPYYWAGFILLE